MSTPPSNLQEFLDTLNRYVFEIQKAIIDKDLDLIRKISYMAREYVHAYGYEYKELQIDSKKNSKLYKKSKKILWDFYQGRCEICCNPATGVHHLLGRGKLRIYNNLDFLLLCCSKCHDQIDKRVYNWDESQRVCSAKTGLSSSEK